MDFKTILLLIIGVANLSLGVITFINNKKSRVNFTWGIVCFSVFLWTIAMVAYRLSGQLESVFWCQMLYVTASLIPTTLLYFVYLFPDEKISLTLWRQLLIFLPNLIVVILILWPNFIIEDIIIRQGQEKEIIWGQGYPIYVGYIIGYFLWPLAVLFSKYVKSKDLIRLQLKYILVGVFFSVIFGTIFNLFLPSFHDFRFNWMGQVATIIYVVFVTAAITKYRLFEIKVILTEFFVAAIAVILFIQTLLGSSMATKAFNFVFLTFFCFFGFNLIKATQEESRRREEAERVAVRERELRREAEELATNLKHLNEAKNQFLLSTQHHLRSPLSVVQGYLSMIGEGSYGKLPAKAKEKIDISLDTTKKLIHLVNELLDVAHFQMNKGVVAKQPTDVVGLAAGVISDLAKSAELKNLFLRFEKPDSPIAPISIDPNGFREAVYNIIDNAIKYTRKGGVTVSIATAAGRLRLIVADTGIGMDASDKLNLFNRTFERGDKAKKINATGKGIGLYLAAQMIFGNGGTLQVESEGRGKGSRFIIELPLGVNGSLIDRDNSNF